VVFQLFLDETVEVFAHFAHKKDLLQTVEKGGELMRMGRERIGVSSVPYGGYDSTAQQPQPFASFPRSPSLQRFPRASLRIWRT
jgi:hypothetical protein